MADEDVTNSAELEDNSESENDEYEEEEFMSASEELSELKEQATAMGSRFKQFAANMKNHEARAVLLFMAGDVVSLIEDVISTVGAHWELREEEEAAEGLDLDDAKLIYRTLLANNKLWVDVKGSSGPEQSAIIQGIIEMNDDTMRRVVELSDDELPELIQQETAQTAAEIHEPEPPN